MSREIPVIYYAHCPACHVVGDFFLEDLERLEDESYKYDCNCGLGQVMQFEDLPTDEREAFKHSVNNLLEMNNRISESYYESTNEMQDTLVELTERYSKLRLANNQINTMVFIIEKNVRDIIKALKKKNKEEAIKYSKAEANDLLQFVLKEQDKVKNNGKGIETQAKESHWSDFVEQVFKEDKQKTKTKNT